MDQQHACTRQVRHQARSTRRHWPVARSSRRVRREHRAGSGRGRLAGVAQRHGPLRLERSSATPTGGSRIALRAPTRVRRRVFSSASSSFTNFDLELEFWVDTAANSGVFLRCQDSGTITDTSCYEANIFDTRPDQTYRTGSIVNVAEPAEFVYTGGQWNRLKITAAGTRLQVTLNDRAMVDTQDSRFSSGPIALQYGAGRSCSGTSASGNGPETPGERVACGGDALDRVGHRARTGSELGQKRPVEIGRPLKNALTD